MKILKRILSVVAGLMLLGVVSGFVYFKHQFQAKPNQLEIPPATHQLSFQWVSDSLGNELNPYAAMVLPVSLPGCTRKFFMQVDLGAPSSLFYKNKLDAIHSKFKNVSIKTEDGKYSLNDYNFCLDKMKIKARKINVWKYDRSKIDWNDSTKVEIIGSIGSDLIDNRIAIFDYKRQIITLTQTLPDSILSKVYMSPFEWSERRVLLPVKIDNVNTKVIFDTGTSAFSLLTDPKTWEKISRKKAAIHQFNVNSWGNNLVAFTAPTDYSASFEGLAVPLKTVTYIEGISFVQRMLMQFSGMGGMVGNRIFIDKVLILDTKSAEFGIIE